jgi:hypothetical protein
MNYKNSALAEIESMAGQFKDYTLGQIILAITKRKPNGVSLSEWLLNVTDEDLYTEIERTKLIEAEDENIN